MKSKTTQHGGGDMPLDDLIRWVYWKKEKFSSSFSSYKHEFRVPFEFERKEKREFDSEKLRRHFILNEKPFLVNKINVVKWFEELDIIGKGKLEFSLDQGFEAVFFDKEEKHLIASFSDSSVAMLFKLVFVV